MFNACVYRAVERLDLFNCFKSGHHRHLIVNDDNSQCVFFLLKLIEVLGATVNYFLAIIQELAVINQADFLEDYPKGLDILEHAVRTDYA